LREAQLDFPALPVFIERATGYLCGGALSPVGCAIQVEKEALTKAKLPEGFDFRPNVSSLNRASSVGRTFVQARCHFEAQIHCW
jgi:hypothetical protein